jgi:hypothetical protein
MILLLLAAGCVSGTTTSGDALCDGTRQYRADLTEALLIDGGDQSVTAGQRLIAAIDAGC